MSYCSIFCDRLGYHIENVRRNGFAHKVDKRNPEYVCFEPLQLIFFDAAAREEQIAQGLAGGRGLCLGLCKILRTDEPGVGDKSFEL